MQYWILKKFWQGKGDIKQQQSTFWLPEIKKQA